MNVIALLERKFPRLGVPNLIIYLVVGQALVFALMMFKGGAEESAAGAFVGRLSLVGDLVLAGEVWRVFTFMLVPSSTSLLWVFFELFLLYLYGTALEGIWGPTKFTIYLGIGWFLTVLVGFIFPGVAVTNLYLMLTIFLAFASVMPNYELYLYFVLPVKVKYLAYLTAATFAYSFYRGDGSIRATIGAATLTYLLCFGGLLVARWRNRGAAPAASREKAPPAAPAAPVATRTCKTCGATDLTHPERMFFFADDDQCYCEVHAKGL